MIKTIFAIFSISFVNARLTRDILDSEKELKKAFWTNNYGLNIKDYNNDFKYYLESINNNIITDSIQDLEQYRIKNPTDALYSFKTDNVTGTYFVNPIQNKFSAKNIIDNLVLEMRNNTNRNIKLKSYIIKYKNKLNKLITDLNIEYTKIIELINIEYDNSNKESYYNKIFGSKASEVKNKKIAKLNKKLEEIKEPIKNAVILHRTLKELYLLISSDLSNNYISSNIKIMGVEGTDNIYKLSKDLMLYYEEMGNKLRNKIQNLMEDQIDALQGKILRDIGNELIKRGVPKMIGIGDINQLSSMLLSDTIKIASLLDKDIDLIDYNDIKTDISFSATRNYLKNIEIQTAQLKKYISESKNKDNYQYLLPNNNKITDKTNWEDVKIYNKKYDDISPLGFDLQLYNDYKIIPISENRQIMMKIEDIIRDKIPILRNINMLKDKVKKFQRIYNIKVDEFKDTEVLKIMREIIERRNQNNYNYNNIYETAFNELSSMIIGIEKASPNVIYKQLIKIAIIKELDINELDSSDILISANAIAKNLFSNKNLLNKFKKILSLIESNIIDGTPICYELLFKSILENPKIKMYIHEQNSTSPSIEDILKLGLSKTLKIESIFNMIKLYVSNFKIMIEGKSLTDIIINELKYKLDEKIEIIRNTHNELTKYTIDNNNKLIQIGALTGATIIGTSIIKYGTLVAVNKGAALTSTLLITSSGGILLGAVIGGTIIHLLN